MTSTATAPYELTSADIRELKKSRAVSFHARWQEGELTQSCIRAHDDDAAGNGYLRAEIGVPSMLSYGGGIVRQNRDVRAYEYIGSSQFHEHWATIVSLLRAGDRLTLVWSANGGRSPIIARAGLAVDELSVRIMRGKRQMFFHIETRVSEYNTARTFTLGDSFSPVISDRNREDGL